MRAVGLISQPFKVLSSLRFFRLFPLQNLVHSLKWNIVNEVIQVALTLGDHINVNSPKISSKNAHSCTFPPSYIHGFIVSNLESTETLLPCLLYASVKYYSIVKWTIINDQLCEKHKSIEISAEFVHLNSSKQRKKPPYILVRVNCGLLAMTLVRQVNEAVAMAAVGL